MRDKKKNIIITLRAMMNAKGDFYISAQHTALLDYHYLLDITTGGDILEWIATVSNSAKHRVSVWQNTYAHGDQPMPCEDGVNA